MATCPGVLGGRGVETCGPVPPLSHTPEFVLSVISSYHDAHSTRILMLWERENDGEGRQRNRQRKRETLQAFWLRMLSFVASSVAVAPCPCTMAHPALLCLRRYVHQEAVLKLVAQFMGSRCTLCDASTGLALRDGSRQWQWWCMACATQLLDLEAYNYGGSSAEPMGSSTLASSLHMDG